MAGVINGTVVDINGNAVQGATVYAIWTEVTPARVIGQDTTDVSGAYSIGFDAGGEVHVVAEWDDGADTFNSRSRPFVTVDYEIPDSGVSRWTFDDEHTEPGIAVDIWGGNDGEINGATTGVAGEISEAYEFGSGDYIDTPFSFGTVSEMSFSIWYYTSTTDTQIIFDTYADGTQDYFRVRLQSDGYRFTFGSNPASSEIGPDGAGSIELDSWTHFVGTAGNGFTLYEDGDEIYSNTSPTTYSTTGSGRFGAFAVDGSVENMQGRLDDPRFYSKELTSTEVTNLYNTGSING